MDLLTLLLFISAVILLSITPGPDVFLILGRGISQGAGQRYVRRSDFFLRDSFRSRCSLSGLQL